MRVVFDTCVWVSAIRSRRGASFALLSEISMQRFRFGISVPLFLEYKAELHKTRTAGEALLTESQVEAILSALAFYGIEVPIYFQLRPNLKDENDNMVFECGAHFGASSIITHNVKDFQIPELGDYDIDIVTPGQFIHNLRRKS